MWTQLGRRMVAGWAGSFAGNALLGAAFSSPWIGALLYDPRWQSRLFIELTPTRDVTLSVLGLVVLGAIHGVLYGVLRPSIPGRVWWARGLFWGATIWAVYWLFQEWFIYITLLGEPWPLALLELAILLAGALVEGLVIARLVEPR